MVIGPAQIELAETPSSPNQNATGPRKYGQLPNRVMEDSDQKKTLSAFVNEGSMHGRSNSFEDEEDYGQLPG